MRIAVQKINNRGIEVSRNKVRLTTEKYVKQLGQACERLYDEGYLASPLLFDEDAFMHCLFEEYPELVPLCRNVTTGGISLSTQQISYVLKAIGAKHGAYDALSVAKSALEASQALSDISAFLEAVHFKKKSDILLCRSSLTVSNKVYTSGKLNLDSPYVRECFFVKPGHHIEEFNYSIEILRAVLKSLGVEDEVTLYDDSVLLGDSFTIADDCEFLNLIICGDIEGHGKYASQLHKAVEKYYSDYYSSRTTIAECIKYEEQMFLNAIPSAIALVNAYRAEHPDHEEFFVDSKRVYWLVAGPDKRYIPVWRDIFIGEDAINLGETGVPVMNRLLGYSGAFMYRFDSALANYEVIGSPVIMYTLDGEKRVPVEYYPAANLRRKHKTLSTSVSPSGYSRKFRDAREVCEELEIRSLRELASEVADCIEVEYSVNAKGFKQLVGVLVQTLVCVLCDFTLDGRKSPNHIHLGSEYLWVTDEIYADACAVAETFFLKLDL